MSLDYIGVVVDPATKRCYSVIVPDHPHDDTHLDEPHHLLIETEHNANLVMVKVRRDNYRGCLCPDDLDAVLTKALTALP